MDNNPVYILLPICVEFEYDVFLSLLRNVVGRVGRTKLTGHYLDEAFKSGMMTENIVVDDDDITSSWHGRDSQRNRIRQSKLLGYWSTTNFPTLGKVFFGNGWHAPKGNFVKVETRNGSKTMTAAEIDEIMLPKLKCCVVELNVCESTLTNLKHFVKVPINEIDVGNGSKISPKINIFDIKNNFVRKCWAALKHGEWLENINIEVRRNRYLS